jgi:hypothetical protein
VTVKNRGETVSFDSSQDVAKFLKETRQRTKGGGR